MNITLLPAIKEKQEQDLSPNPSTHTLKEARQLDKTYTTTFPDMDNRQRTMMKQHKEMSPVTTRFPALQAFPGCSTGKGNPHKAQPPYRAGKRIRIRRQGSENF